VAFWLKKVGSSFFFVAIHLVRKRTWIIPYYVKNQHNHARWWFFLFFKNICFIVGQRAIWRELILVQEKNVSIPPISNVIVWLTSFLPQLFPIAAIIFLSIRKLFTDLFQSFFLCWSQKRNISYHKIKGRDLDNRLFW
jgi:hypothetical protein